MSADTTYPPLGLQRRQDGTTAIPTGGSLDIESGGSLKIAGVAVTASAAELNALAGNGLSAAELGVLDGATAGAAVASKAVVVDASKDVSGLHNVGFTQESEHANQRRVTLSADTTLSATHIGAIIDVDTDAKVLTLPATVVGMIFRIRNAGADGAVLVTVSPNASDKIMGGGFTAADDKDALNTKATAKKGDEIWLLGDGVDGWYVVGMRGTWARQA